MNFSNLTLTNGWSNVNRKKNKKVADLIDQTIDVYAANYLGTLSLR